MAAKPSETDDRPGKGAKIMGLLVKLSYGLGLVSAAVLFLAAIDFHMFNLTRALAPAALPALVLLIVCGGLGGVASMMGAGSTTGQAETANDVLAARLESRMKTVEDKFSAYLGTETEALKKQRDDLSVELAAIRQAEEEKRKADEERRQEEFEQLKQQNMELQEQLRQAGLAMVNAVSENQTASAEVEDAA